MTAFRAMSNTTMYDVGTDRLPCTTRRIVPRASQISLKKLEEESQRKEDARAREVERKRQVSPQTFESVNFDVCKPQQQLHAVLLYLYVR